MMGMKFTTSAVLLLFAFMGTAQSVVEEVPKFQLSNAYMYLNFPQIEAPRIVLSDYRALAPNSKILAADFSDFEEIRRRNHAGNGGFDLMVGVKVRNKDQSGYRENLKIRVGVGYSVGVVFESELRDDKFKPYDTIPSSINGDPVYLDSARSENVGLRFTSDFIRLHLSIIMYTDEDARVSLYGGLGFYGSYGYYNTLTVSHSLENYVIGADSQELVRYYERNKERSSTLEVFEGESSFGAALYAPLGFDFRVSMTHSFWQRVHLFFEVQPGIDVSKISSFGVRARPFATTGLGLRVI